MEKYGKGGWALGVFLLALTIALLVTPLGADARTIKIGVLGPMNFVQGDHAWKGSQIALEEIMAKGGIDVGGEMMPVELVRVDTNEILSMVDATSAVERAITKDKVDFLIGGCSSGAILAMQEVTSDYKKIFLTCGSGSHPELTNRVGKNYDRYKYFFRAGSYSAEHIVSLTIASLSAPAKAIREQLGVKKIKLAMLFEQAKWLDPQIPLYNTEIPKLGIDIVGIWRMSMSALDVSAQLTAIRDSGAHIILAMTSGPVAIPMYRQIGELEIPAFITGVNVEAEGAKFYSATGGMCNYGGFLALISDVEMSPRTIPFFRKFEAKYGERPNLLAVSYSTLFILKEAIERAKSLDSDKVVAALEKTDYQAINGRTVYTKNHDSIFGPGYQAGAGVQWLPGGKLSTYWPTDWQGVSYKGVTPVQLSPWMVKYWKEKK